MGPAQTIPCCARFASACLMSGLKGRGQMPLGMPPMNDRASGAAPLNSAPEKSKPGCCGATKDAPCEARAKCTARRQTRSKRSAIMALMQDEC